MYKRVRFVGFCFLPSTKPNHFVQYCLYEESSTYFLLCGSEGSGSGDHELASDGLGSTVAKVLIEPFIRRTLETNFTEVKKLLEKSVLADWEWVDSQSSLRLV